MNRTKKVPLKNCKDLLKTPRGSHYFLQDEMSVSVIVQWHDSNIVTLASNCHSVEPLGQARRWSHKEKKVVTISQPHTVAAYNKYMSGVDRLDQNVATHRISVRTKKWWWPLFSFLISATVNNAWLLYRDTETYRTDNLDLLEVRCHRLVRWVQVNRCPKQNFYTPYSVTNGHHIPGKMCQPQIFTTLATLWARHLRL